MAFILNDRVKQTSTTVGTISMVVDGSLTGFVTFTAGIGDTNVTYYTIVGEDVASEWEVGIGTYTSSGTSLSRDTIINSSTGSKVDFSEGTKVVFCTMPGEKIAYKDSSGNAVNSVSYKQEGTNFVGSLLVGHSTTGTLNNALNNTAVGIGALNAVTTGDNSVAVGNDALGAMASGTRNTMVGHNSGEAMSAGCNDNTGVGQSALQDVGASAVVGTGNTALGAHGLMNVTSGDYNIGVGYNVADNLTTGSGNVIIGSGVDAAAVDSERTLQIAGYDGSTTTTWISGDSSGNITVPGTVTADSQQLVGAGFAIAMSIAL